MFFIPSDKKKQFAVYTRSRHLAGVIFLLYGILCYVNYTYDIRNISALYATAFSLSIYYLAGILFGFSLTPLLDQEYYCRKRIIQAGIKYFFFLLIISLVFLLKKPYDKAAIIVAAIYFFSDAFHISYILLKRYRKCVKNINNYYSEYCVESYVHWMYKVTILIVIYGLSFTFIAGTNKTLIASFSFFGIFLIIYIAISYNNYLMYVVKIDQSQENSNDDSTNEPDDEDLTKDPLTFAEIETHLKNWIDKKEFLNGKITIASLCTELNTNRTYLSYYINNIYGCSFRDFISDLRIAEAKKLLAENTSADINEIAISTGFSTTSNFYRTFKKVENITPANYRDLIKN